jgi:hypothetical protein
MEDEEYSYELNNIADLRKWCYDCGFPADLTHRVYIDSDAPFPGAIGIYKDEEKNLFYVYKNDKTKEATRTIIYKGPSEKEAVEEMSKIIEEKFTSSKINNWFYNEFWPSYGPEVFFSIFLIITFAIFLFGPAIASFFNK